MFKKVGTGEVSDKPKMVKEIREQKEKEKKDKTEEKKVEKKK